jgi:hypothetical protein
MRYSLVLATLTASALAVPAVNIEVVEPGNSVEDSSRHGHRRGGWLTGIFSTDNRDRDQDRRHRQRDHDRNERHRHRSQRNRHGRRGRRDWEDDEDDDDDDYDNVCSELPI